MLFPEEHAPLLKAWIVKRLENTSDADADVLAEYVLALLRHDGSEDDVRKLCEAEIPDFLKEDSSVFVSDVFSAIRFKSYLPGAPLQPPKQPGPLPLAPAQAQAQAQAQAEAQAQAQGQTQTLPYDDIPMTLAPPTGPSQNGSRKRSYHERGDVEAQGGRDFMSGRSFKQPRRGRGGRVQDAAGFRGGPPAPAGYPNANYSQQFPVPRPGAGAPPAFDPSGAMDALIKLQGLGMPLPPMPEFPPQGRPGAHPGQPARRRQRCRDYDTKGYCARGNTCMFEHGSDSIFVPPPVPLPQSQNNEEYDPSNASIMMTGFGGLGNTPQQSRPFAQSKKGQPGGPRDKPQNRRARAPFSAEGPVNDRTKSTVVVENIPEEHFSEEEVRTFFSQFGNVVEVSMQPYKRLAIVKFDNWSAASAAYRSPKVIFDNRFVKVFWYKEDAASSKSAAGKPSGGAGGSQNGAGGAGSPGAPGADLDMGEFLRKQDEAQKAHEEKVQRKQDVERKREELEKRQRELIAKQQEEKDRLMAKLRAASNQGEAGSEGQGAGGSASPSSKPAAPTSQTEALRAQLAALETEAKQLGLDPDSVEDGSAAWNPRGGGSVGRGRGRGGAGVGGPSFRGRGGFASRGSLRGALRGGRGGNHAAYAVYSLDNRPRKVCVTGVDFTVPEKDETLRQYLYGVGEFTDIQTTSAMAQITFKDRKTAEKFFYGITDKEIPGIEGQVELSWVTGAPGAGANHVASVNGGVAATGSPGTAAASNAEQQQQQQQQQHRQNKMLPGVEDTVMGGADGGGGAGEKEAPAAAEQAQEQADMDYDVADEDQWGID